MISVQTIGSITVLKPRSALVGECLTLCRQAIKDSLHRHRTHLIVDLTECPLVASAGLEMLLDSQTECLRLGGKLVISEPQDLCNEIFDITGVSESVGVFKDMRSALSDFAR
ncbi:MAG: STAS domain-containing protein [Planctomycetales bacterium]|nr:STAS domain-containing protein [Planctomycetales bacterium]